jgi:CubicO group peptidase (beta-lactamase class C family)
MHAIDKILINEIRKNKTPSVQYTLFNVERIIHEFSDGFADIKNKKRVNDYTTYNVFSVTKTFTALAILQLAEKEKLNIDDPIKKYLPNFPYGSDVKIWQLMTHTAGVPNPNPLNWIHLDSEHKNFNRTEFFDQIFQKYPRLKSQPNEKFSYSNLGYVLLGRLIEKLSDQKYEDYIKEWIINPLELYPTELDFVIYNKKEHAKGYQKKISLLNLALGFFIKKSIFMDPEEDAWIPFKNYYTNHPAYGGLIGRPQAFILYIQELLKPNSSLISDNSKKMLFTENRTNNGKASGMALSWFSGKLNSFRYFTHAGGGGGYYTEIRIYPELKMGSVLVLNRTGISDQRFLDKLDKHYIKIY